MFGQHLTLATRNRAAVFLEEAVRLAALHKLADVAGDALWSFCLVDDHLHAALLLDRTRAAYTASALSRALQPLIGARLAPAHLEPVETRAHAARLPRYHMRQPRHHKLDHLHPATWSGSCFQDLVRARDLGIRLRIAEVLPRFREVDALAAVDLPARQIEPATDEQVRTFGVQRLTEAAARALAADAELRGKHRAVMRARRAVCQLGHAAGFSSSQLGWSLGISSRTANRLKNQPIVEQMVQAIRRQLALRSVGSATAGRTILA